MNAVTITVTIPMPPPPPGNGTVSYFLRKVFSRDARTFTTLGTAAEAMIRLGTDNCTLHASCPHENDYICTRWNPRQQTWSEWL